MQDTEDYLCRLLIDYLTYLIYSLTNSEAGFRALANRDRQIFDKLKSLSLKYKNAKNFSTKCTFNEKAVANYLRNHPEKEAKFKLFIEGSSVGLAEGFDVATLNRRVKNIIFTRDDVLEMLDRLEKELERGYITPGCGWYQLNLLCVPKKDAETGLMTKIRVARHASFNAPGSVALNDAIDETQKGMEGELTLPSFVTYLWFFISVRWISLRDLKDAFRQLLLTPADQNLIQYSLFGLTFVDLRQAYGSASAANRCQEFSTTLKWMVANNSRAFEDDEGRVLIEMILAYIDDFTIGAQDKETCEKRTQAFDKIANDINAPISVEKNEDCVQRGIANGIGFKLDTTPRTIFVPKPKALDIVNGTLGVLIYEWITAEALETLIGRIIYWSQFDSRAKIFCNRGLRALQHDLRRLPKKIKLQTIVRANPRLRKSLDLYLRFFLQFREVPIVDVLFQPSISITATSDASDLGGGFMCANSFCAYTFSRVPDSQGIVHQAMDINKREAHAVLMLLWNCRHQLSGRELHLLVDNESVKWGLRKFWSKSDELVDWIEEITSLALALRIGFRVHYIPSRLNHVADQLSRGPAGRHEFNELCETLGWDNLNEIVIPHHNHISYYESLRIITAPIAVPEWTHYLPNKKSKYLNPEVLKMWHNPKR